MALLEESIGVEFEVPVYGGRCDPSRAGALLSPAPFPAAMAIPAVMAIPAAMAMPAVMAMPAATAMGSPLWDSQPQIDIFSRLIRRQNKEIFFFVHSAFI